MVCLLYGLEIHFRDFFPLIIHLYSWGGGGEEAEQNKTVIAQTLTYAEGDSFCLQQPEELGHPSTSAWHSVWAVELTWEGNQSLFFLHPPWPSPQVFNFLAFLLFGGLKKQNNQEMRPCTDYFASVFWDQYQRLAVCPRYVLAVTGLPVSWCGAAHVDLFL